MVYKIVTNSFEKNKYTIATLNNNFGACCITPINGVNNRPCDGVYIEQRLEDNWLLVPNVCETLTIDGKEIVLNNYSTSEEVNKSTEYLKETQVEEKIKFIYEVDNVKIEKAYIMHTEQKILCVEYVVTNKNGKSVSFSSKPLFTCRKLNEIKRKSAMKYMLSKFSDNQNGFRLSLSIIDKIDIYSKAVSMKFKQQEGYVCGVHLDDIQCDKNIKTYVEDLYYAGVFEANIKGNSTLKSVLYFSTENIQNTKFNINDIKTKANIAYADRLKGIDEKFFELRGLATSAYNFYYIDNVNKKIILIDEVPKVNDTKLNLVQVVMSIEGNYLKLKRYKEAFKILNTIMQKLKFDDKIDKMEKCEAFLMFSEAVNRYYHDADCKINEIRSMYDYIKQEVYTYIAHNDTTIFMDLDYMLKTNQKKFIRINALWYNTLKILIQFMDKFMDKSDNIYEITIKLRENILKKFFDENTKIFKNEINDVTSYANIDMIYTMSLSFPMVDEALGIKIVDTCFKELYTPLGMRNAAINSDMYDGYVYPHLMVYFLKANLRQMGITRATQKIGYNLVKELLQQINKNIVGSICYRYNDKTKLPERNTMNALTNAECIRLYDMLM